MIVDTHALIWPCTTIGHLGPLARSRLDAATREGGFGVSAITPWEIALLAQKGRLTLSQDVGV